MENLDPVFRCHSCQKLVKLETLHKLGVCPHCGNKRVIDLKIFNEDEAAQIKEWGYEDFLKEFEGVEE